MDFSELNGGLGRMLRRLLTEGTATQNLEADRLLREDANAALVGLLLDQRVRAETAFIGPLKLQIRLGHFDMEQLADMDPRQFREVFSEPPAVHRFTNVMAERVQKLASVLATQYGGNASNIWSDGADLAQIERRIRALPGFGPLKTRKIRFVLHYFGHRLFQPSEYEVLPDG